MPEAYDGLRSFIRACEEIGECLEIEGADWDKEIGALTEASAEFLDDPPMMLFDKINGYPAGHRVLSLAFCSAGRVAIAMGLPHDKTKLELVRLAAAKIKGAKPIPPEEVADGPVMENRMTENEVDLLQFPVLFNHELDGGRYIGTGDSVINVDPDSGFINVGTYRMQVHEPNLLGLYMSPGQHGRTICERYWAEGKSCPVVVTFGGDPLIFLASHTKYPWGTSELDGVGGLRGEPLEVIKGPITGLPIPAHAEIAIEGEIPPIDTESRVEGPFGEWTGYYVGGATGDDNIQPVVRVKAVYWRNNPILLNMSPQWPGADPVAFRYAGGLIWDQLEAAGIPDVVGVYAHNMYFVAVSIRQRYAGHAKQAGLATVSCAAAARHGRYVVIVDEDIDPTNFQEVFWAMQTRVNPKTDIELIDGCWTAALDPRMPPEQRAAGDFTNSRAIFYAVKPFTWREEFPIPNRGDRETLRAVMKKYSDILPFPSQG